MNTSAFIMTSVPFTGIVMTATLVSVCAIMACVAVLAIATSLKERRATQLEMANANPELEAFGLPMAKTSRKRDVAIDTGAILKSEGYSV